MRQQEDCVNQTFASNDCISVMLLLNISKCIVDTKTAFQHIRREDIPKMV